MSGRIRCAIYTRKSSEEGLDQSFNSLDAQREACEAFVLSQRHEGWQALPTHYDDGGFSGGNMERPALKRLMADIQQGKVNNVVVYKVDRLTRSLADFAKMIESFDAGQVSFVSVTQQFNTTSSMGRLTLNVLLSFAQFEREVTGERIRDKIAASKKKGMWMGGYVPLGYDLRERKIYVNPIEAKTVRTIFTDYLRLGCVMALKEHLDRNEILSKERTLQVGTKTGGTNFSRGALYKILRNHIYVGEIEHKGAIYPGQHEAIISREVWNQVQRCLVENQQGKRRKARVTKASLFTGILFDEGGNRYTPTHTNKSGRRYRYYTSQAVIRKATQTAEPARIPAQELEVAVITRLLAFLNTPREVLNALRDLGGKTERYSGLLAQAAEMAANWTALPSERRERFLKTILDRVIIQAAEIEIRIRKNELLDQLAGRKSAQPTGDRETFHLLCSFRHVSRGKAVRIILDDSNPSPVAHNLAVLKAIVRARNWRSEIISGAASGISDLARIHKLSKSYVKRIYPFANLSPASIEAILDRKVRPEFSLDSMAHGVPIFWAEQKIIGPGA